MMCSALLFSSLKVQALIARKEAVSPVLLHISIPMLTLRIFANLFLNLTFQPGTFVLLYLMFLSFSGLPIFYLLLLSFE